MRVVRGLTQQDLANAIGKTRSLISHLERSGEANKHTLKEIADVFQVPVQTLLSETEVSFPNANEPAGHYSSVSEAEKMIVQLQKEINFLKENTAKQWDWIFEFSRPFVEKFDKKEADEDAS